MASSGAPVEVEETQFSKPGQRYPTPSPGAGGRVFYESLYREKPASQMALVYCIEYGVLPLEEAKTVYAAYMKAKQSKGSKVAPTPDKGPAAKRARGAGDDQ